MPKTILVIDDEEKITKILSFILSRESFDVKCANNSQNGLRIAREGRIDLIITDIMMPGMNGYELGEELKKDPITSNIPFIFLTAKGEVADKFAGYFVGAADYVTKPFKTEDLISKVNRVLGLVSAEQIDDGTPANVKARMVDSTAPPATYSVSATKASVATPPAKTASGLSLSEVVETYQSMLIALWAGVTDKIDSHLAAEAMSASIQDLAERYPLLAAVTVSTSGPILAGIKRDLEEAEIDDVNESLTELIASFFERICGRPKEDAEGVKVLVFDEKPQAIEFYSAVLKGAGFAIETVETCDGLFEAMKENPPDLILISAMMENNDIFETCRRLKCSQQTARTPILMVSDVYDSENIKRSFAHGVSDYLVKPFSDSELVSAIISLIHEC